MDTDGETVDWHKWIALIRNLEQLIILLQHILFHYDKRATKSPLRDAL